MIDCMDNSAIHTWQAIKHAQNALERARSYRDRLKELTLSYAYEDFIRAGFSKAYAYALVY